MFLIPKKETEKHKAGFKYFTFLCNNLRVFKKQQHLSPVETRFEGAVFVQAHVFSLIIGEFSQVCVKCLKMQACNILIWYTK